MSTPTAKKRERCRNFLEEEKENLISIVLEYKNILENKKTDAVSSQQKHQTWETVAHQFNSISKTATRTGMQLKLLYEGMKEKAKQHKADDKVRKHFLVYT